MFHHDPQHLIDQIIKNQERLMADITALSAAVTDNTTAVNAAVAKLQEAGVPAQSEVDALTTAITESVTSLNNAVAAAA